MADDSSHLQKRKLQNDSENDGRKPPRKKIVPTGPGRNPQNRERQKRLAFEKLSPEDQEAALAKCKAEEEARKAKEELEIKKNEKRSLLEKLLKDQPNLRIKGENKFCKDCWGMNYSRYWCPECPCCICNGDDHMADWCPRKKDQPWQEKSIQNRNSNVLFAGEPLSSSRPEAIKEKNQKRLQQFRCIRSSILAPGNVDIAKHLTSLLVRYHLPITYCIIN